MQFQFHYGTIKSGRLAFQNEEIGHLNFNSTMVRLKVRSCQERAGVRNSYFNSTMVRLKEPAKSGGGLGGLLFQFHYGTIKSGVSRQNITTSPNLFQFHYGTIKRQLKLFSPVK